MACGVLDSDGNSFSPSTTVLDSDGNSFVVSTSALDSDGNSFTVCSGAAQYLIPSLYTDADTFHAATVAAGYNLQPAVFADGDTFYSTTVWQAGGETIYYVIYQFDLSAPSAAQVKAGHDSNGDPAVASGSQAAPGSTQIFTFSSAATGLSAGTSYRVALVWSDSLNDSNVSVSDAWDIVQSFSTARAIGRQIQQVFRNNLQTGARSNIQINRR